MNVLFIGGIHIGKRPRGGEEYKNQVFLRQLKKYHDCKAIDTSGWKRNPFTILSLLIHIVFFEYDNLVISASSKSTYILLKFINLFPSKIKKTSYFVIGGYFPKAIQLNVFNTKYYKKLKSIVVEGELLHHQLISAGLQNVCIIPNFKDFPLFIPSSHSSNNQLRFVFLSKICVDKGVMLIFEAIERLRLAGFDKKYSITFYGPVDATFKDVFKSRLSGNIQYKGELNFIDEPENSYSTLKNYDCLLFPTMWAGEGFPGVIIDAFISGLAIIASDWNMNGEIVQNDVNGIIVPCCNSEALSSAMEFMINNIDHVQRMKQNAEGRAIDYHINQVWPRVEDILMAS